MCMHKHKKNVCIHIDIYVDCILLNHIKFNINMVY